MKRRAGLILLPLLACSQPQPATEPDASAPATTRILVFGDVGGTLLDVDEQGGLPRAVSAARGAQGAVVLDAGDRFFRGYRVPVPHRLRAQAGAEVLAAAARRSRISAMAVGERDLALGLPSLRRLAGQAGLRLVSANLHHAVSGTVAFSRFALIERGGRTLGVVAASPVFGPEDPQREAYVWAGLEARAPGPALSAAVAEARAAGASEVVALLHLPAVVAEGLLPTLDVEAAIIAHDRGPGRAAGRLGWLPGRGRAFAEVNLRGKAAQVALRPVAAPMPEDAAIAAAIDLAQQPQAPDAPAYMGNRACAAKCHAEALRHYDKTGHAKAFERLRAERQTRNRDCLPCHTTGYARPGGPRFSVAIRKFRNVGCESCHPPMPAHAEAPEVNRMGPVDHLVCAQCHRLQAYQRPFELGARWKAVLGPGHGL